MRKLSLFLALCLFLTLTVPAAGSADALSAAAGLAGTDAAHLLQSKDLQPGSSVSDWAAFFAGRTGEETEKESYLQGLWAYVTRLYRDQGGLSQSKATDWHRISLTVLSLGADPTCFGRRQDGTLIDLIADGTYAWSATENPGTQGANGWIFSLITLDAKLYAVPAGSRFDRAAILSALLACQEADGGFGLVRGSADVDITAMALLALAPYSNATASFTDAAGTQQTVAQAAERALTYLSRAQTASGDFESWGDANCDSTAQVVLALCSLGLDPAADPRFVKDGGSARDGLLRYRLPDGSFAHTMQEQTGDLFTTEQAGMALLAMERLASGGRRLYDLREPMDPAVQAEIAALNEALAGAGASEAPALYRRYLALPAAERSYVSFAAARFSALGVSLEGEDPAESYNVTLPGDGTITYDADAPVWPQIVGGGVLIAAAAGFAIWKGKKKHE